MEEENSVLFGLDDLLENYYHDDVRNKHKNALENEQKRKDEEKEKKIEELKRQRDEKIKRRIERQRRKHEKEMEELKTQIKEELLSKGEFIDSCQEIYNMNFYNQKDLRGVPTILGHSGQIAIILYILRNKFIKIFTEPPPNEEQPPIQEEKPPEEEKEKDKDKKTIDKSQDKEKSQPGTVSNPPEEGDISKNINILHELFGIDLKNKIANMASMLNNCAFSSLIMFISIYILIAKKKINRFIIYLPSLFIFIILLIGTPIAFSSRYIIYTILFIPFSLIIPFIKN